MNRTHKILFTCINIFNIVCFITSIINIIIGSIFIFSSKSSNTNAESGIITFFSIIFLIIGLIFLATSINGYLYIKYHCKYQFRSAKKFLIINMIFIFFCSSISIFFGFIFFPYFIVALFGFITFFCSIKLVRYYKSIIENEVIMINENRIDNEHIIDVY